MAKINRYTRLTPAKYNPLSLEEIMMVPLLKRKQHDDLLNGVAQTREGLAQVDPLDIHAGLVAEKQAELEAALQAQVDDAATNGISSKLRGDFINLNGQYQKEMGPEGTLGKANQIREKYEKQKAEILANAVQLGHNPSKTMENLENWYADYAANHDGKTLEELNMPLPPNYRRIQDALQEVKALHGSTIRTDRGDESFDIVQHPATGALVFKTQSGQLITQSNNDQLNEAKKMLEAEFFTEGGEGYESNKWNGISNEQALTQLNSGLAMMRSTSEQDTRNNQYQLLTDFTQKANEGHGNPVETWTSIPGVLRSAKDGGDPLLNKLRSNPMYNAVADKYGLMGTVYRDGRGAEKAGANYTREGSHEITGETMESIIADPKFRHDGPKGSGIYDEESGEFLYISPSSGDAKQLAIQGTYKGQEYALTVKDPQLYNLFTKHGTTLEGKAAWDRAVARKRSVINDLREAEPFMASYSDAQIAEAYSKIIDENLVYAQNMWRPNNPNNTYFKSTNEDILGVPNSGNLGSIVNRKVRIFNDEGNDLISLNGRQGVDYLSNLLMNNEYDDLNEEEKKAFLNKIQNAHNHGVTIGDHEFANEINYGVTDKNGNNIIFKVENNNQLSGKDSTMLGIDDASQMQNYLTRGNTFVKSENEQMRDEYGNMISINKYFAHIPYEGPNGFTIKPVVIRTRGNIKFNSLKDITQVVNNADLSVPEGLEAYISVETIQDVNARVGAEVARFYNTTPGDGITNKEAQENYGY